MSAAQTERVENPPFWHEVHDWHLKRAIVIVSAFDELGHDRDYEGVITTISDEGFGLHNGWTFQWGGPFEVRDSGRRYTPVTEPPK